MTLYLAEFDTETVYSPGTDGMSEAYERRAMRIVEAKSENEAWEKLKRAVERYEPYTIRVSIEPLKISKVIR